MKNILMVVMALVMFPLTFALKANSQAVSTGVIAKNHDTFRVQVNYDLGVKEMISAGKYDWENDDINGQNFPSKRSGSAQIDIRLIHFNKDMSSEDVLKELDKMGLRPAELPELLALGAEYPDEQRKYPIVALSSMWQSWGSRSVPCLSRDDSGRGLDLYYFGDDWCARFRFAAVGK